MKLTSWIVILLITACAAWLCFWGLGKAPLEPWDEGVNADVIASSFKSRSPFILTKDNQPFFEKPPLWYWATYVPVSVWGQTPTTLRLVSSSAGLLLVLLVIGFTAKTAGVFPGLVSALSLLSARQLFFPNVAGYFSTHTLRSADADSLALLFTVASWVLLCEVSKKRTRLFFPAIAATALAFLAKGPIALLPWISWFAYYVVNKKQLPVSWGKIGLGILAGTVILIPWYGYMTLSFGGDFLSSHILYHQIARITSVLEGHAGPWYFYVSLFFDPRVYPLGIIVGTSALSVFLVKKLRNDVVAFTSAGSVLTLLVFLSFAQTKLAWYILPAYPFAAVLLGKITQFISTKSPSHFSAGN